MTIATTANKIVYQGNGATTNFAFSFAIPTGETGGNIQVYFTSATGVITQLTQGAGTQQYTITFNSPISPNPTPVGGTVVYNPGGSPIALGTQLTIIRTVDDVQSTTFNNQGTLWPAAVEEAFDYLTMLTQQLAELLGRQITVAVSDPTPSALPPAAQRANLVFGFDANGNPTAVAAAPTGVISSAMAPFVGSSTLAAAKALLGYGSMANENIGAAGKGIIDDGAGNARVNDTISAVSTNQAIHSVNHFTDYVSSGTLTYTLDKLSTLFNGFRIRVFCLSGSATFAPNAADTIQSFSSGAGVAITAGQVGELEGDGLGTWYLNVSNFFGVGVGSTMQSFTSGSGATYNTPKGATRLKIRMIGGGGGGAGASTSGGNGGDTIFNSIHAAGGAGAGTPLGIGGTGGAGSAALRIPGGNGGASSGAATQGGVGVFGSSGSNLNSGFTTVPGSGGAAGGTNGGGGAGEYVELIINNPAATYTYTIGAAGAAGTGGATPSAGGVGLIIVEEFYNA